MGVVLILLRGAVEDAVWLGVPVAVGGFALGALALFSARREPGPEERMTSPAAIPQRPGLWFPIGVVLLLLLQAAYLIWWASFTRR
jgi:uncharacterized membrane protein YjjB (DUF3815 family)